jgi:hypothetical protein
MKSGPDVTEHALMALPGEDLDLITELVLKSGSLKDLATSYGVSYPTIRARLDRVIERLQAIKAGHALDPLTDLLATLVERGEISVSAARRVREASQKANRQNTVNGNMNGAA